MYGLIVKGVGPAHTQTHRARAYSQLAHNLADVYRVACLLSLGNNAYIQLSFALN